MFLVRKGNPKGVKGWDDAARPGVEVLYPNPKTSGGAMWDVIAIYGAGLKLAEQRAGGKPLAPEAAASQAVDLLTRVQRNVKVMDKSGRESVTTFERGVGDVIVVSIKEAQPRGKVKKGDVHRAVIVRTRKDVRRADGSVIRFDTNAAVLVNKNEEPIGTRIFGPVVRELRGRGYMKIISLAPEVL